jgi:hypothetical protein
VKIIQENLTSACWKAEIDTETADRARRETGEETRKKCLPATGVHKTGGKPLVLLQVNCRSI